MQDLEQYKQVGRKKTQHYWRKLFREAGLPLPLTQLVSNCSDRQRWKKIVNKRSETSGYRNNNKETWQDGEKLQKRNRIIKVSNLTYPHYNMEHKSSGWLGGHIKRMHKAQLKLFERTQCTSIFKTEATVQKPRDDNNNNNNNNNDDDDDDHHPHHNDLTENFPLKIPKLF